MSQFIGGPGIPLPPGQALYPPVLVGAAPTNGTYQVDIPAGDCLPIPAGQWVVSTTATVGSIQWFDGNVTGQWINFAAPAAFSMMVRSDGVNFRVANLSTSAFTGIVTGAGTNYVQSTTTITAGTGNSTWIPVVGGALSATITTAGVGYTKPPLLFIPEPPFPGVCATAHTVLTSGAVSSVVFGQAGAGYLAAPICTVVPDPFDPALATGGITTAAVITLALTGAGTLTAALLVNFGAPLATAPTLTVSGVGTSATATTSPATVVAAANMVVTLQRATGN
jgi:hypothetical protein